VRAWIDETCEVGPAVADEWTERTALYQKYRMHTITDGSKTLSASSFYSRIEQIGGVVETKRQGTRGFKGIKIAPRGQLSGAAQNGQQGWWGQ